MLLDTIFIDILFFDSPIKNHSRWMETQIMMKKGFESLFILYRTSSQFSKLTRTITPYFPEKSSIL